MIFTPHQTKEIEKIVNDEIQKKLYRLPKVPPHKHDGVDNIEVNTDNIIYPVSINGTITMSQVATYNLNLTGSRPTPKQVIFYGGALNVSAGVHAFITGSAQFGTNQQFQPQSTTSVITGPVITDIIEGSASMTVVNSGPTAFLKNSQGHIVYAEYPSGTIVAAANITAISNSIVTVNVFTLASGWSISGLWTVI